MEMIIFTILACGVSTVTSVRGLLPLIAPQQQYDVNYPTFKPLVIGYSPATVMVKLAGWIFLFLISIIAMSNAVMQFINAFSF